MSQLLVYALFAVGCAVANAVPALPRLNIDHARISISGLSSGADFTVQFQVAFSKTIMGSGVFAGQPYHCAVTRFPDDPMKPPNASVPICEGCPSNSTLIYDHCKNHASLVDVQTLREKAKHYQSVGLIDSLDNLKRTRIYFYRGTHDACYLKGSMQKTVDFFSQFVPSSHLLFNNTIPSAHAWPTDKGGEPCGPGQGPIENCGYDGPGDALTHIYKQLAPPAPAIDRKALLLFDQSPFFGLDNNQTGLSESGYVYIPKSCHSKRKPCALHVSLHGCGVESYYDEAVHTLSFNRWAETNNMVILWPRLRPHGGPHATHQQISGCYDAYAQTGHHYDTQRGVQMRAVRQMLEAVSGVKMALTEGVFV